MPGMFGSSMNEAYELKRMIDTIRKWNQILDRAVSIPSEIADLILRIYDIEMTETDSFIKWNRKNDIKENYRKYVYQGLSGQAIDFDKNQIEEILAIFSRTMEESVNGALREGKGIPPAYFTFEMDEYEENEDGINAKHFNI